MVWFVKARLTCQGEAWRKAGRCVARCGQSSCGVAWRDELQGAQPCSAAHPLSFVEGGGPTVRGPVVVAQDSGGLDPVWGRPAPPI